MNNKFLKILIVSIFFISFLSVFVFDLGQFLSFANYHLELLKKRLLTYLF